MNLENWVRVGSIVIPLTILIGFFWNAMNKRFNKIFEKFDKIDAKFDRVWDEFKDGRKDIYDLHKSVAFLEAQTIMFNAIPEENARSTGAKKMWERRKAHQIKKLEKK